MVDRDGNLEARDFEQGIKIHAPAIVAQRIWDRTTSSFVCEGHADGWYHHDLRQPGWRQDFRLGPQLAPEQSLEVARHLGLTRFRQI